MAIACNAQYNTTQHTTRSNKMDAEKIIKAARKRLIRGHPFHACMSFQLKFIATDSVPAIATDGRHVYYNRGWLEQQSVAQAEGVIAHEIMHVTGFHHLRRGARDFVLWNIACDYAINGTLIKLGFTLPDGGLHDDKHTGRAAEKIYAVLLRERQEKERQEKERQEQEEADGSDDSNGSGSPDESDDSEDGDDASSAGDDAANRRRWFGDDDESDESDESDDSEDGDRRWFGDDDESDDSEDGDDASSAGGDAGDDAEDGTGPSTGPAAGDDDESDDDADTGPAGDGAGDDDAGDASTPDDGQCIWGEVLDGVSDDGNILSEAEIAAEERKLASQIHQAVQVERQASKGQGPCGVDGYLREITESLKGEAQPWHQILREAMNDTIVVDQSYTNPDRRFIHQGVYLADDEPIPNGSLAFIIDTSCSLSEDDLGIIASHAQDIIDDVGPLQVYVAYVDFTLQHIDLFDRGDDVVFKMHGGGGTAFNPAFNWLAREGTVFQNTDGTEVESPGADAIDGLIYFTDGDASVGPDSYHGQGFEVPDYPVFWATTDEDPLFFGCEEFGEIIYVD